MSDLLSPNGVILQWQDSHAFSNNTRHQRAYEALVGDLREIPRVFTTTTEKQAIDFQVSEAAPAQHVWQYMVPGQAVSNMWTEIHPHFIPTKSCEILAGTLTPRPGPPPAIPRLAHRILVGSTLGKATLPSIFGRWNGDNAYLLQHKWQDGTPLLLTSTAQLCNLQALH